MVGQLAGHQVIASSTTVMTVVVVVMPAAPD